MLFGGGASISLTACSNIDFRFEDTSEKQAAPNQLSSFPIVQDNQRRIRDAREDGKMGPKDLVKFSLAFEKVSPYS